MKNLFIVMALALGLAVTASAQVGQNITVTANLTRGLTWTTVGNNGSTLNFGTITLPVTTAPSISPTSTSAVQLSLLGDNNASVSFTIPTSASLTGPGSSNLTFTANVMGSSSQSSPGTISGNQQLSSNGNYYIWVGGNLPNSIPTTQATGQYSGTYEITVQYVGS